MGNQGFLELYSAQAISKILSQISYNSIIFLDIDDTIITPVSHTFRRAPYNQIIDEIKQNKDQYSDFEKIVSNWRKKRKVMLVDAEWPLVINEIKQKLPVYGLTKIDTGSFGSIPSIERWRLDELDSFGVKFSNDSVIPEEGINDASFDSGVFFTGENSKSDTLDYYWPYFSCEHIVMVDDRVIHLEHIRDFCYERSVKFTGILFKGMENLESTIDARIVNLQKNWLLSEYEWLEDDEALKKIDEQG